MSPTITSPALMTAGGVILGTAAYMSPEQARGKVVDKRSDVWAFGCVLFEMLTGRRAFAAADVAEVLAFIITKEPDWSTLPSHTPTGIRRLLRRALAKERNDRLADMGDARLELKEALAPPVEPVRAAEDPRLRERMAWALVALVTTVAGALAVFRVGSVPDTIASPIRFAFALPRNVTFDAINGRAFLAMSPDGRRIAFVARTAGEPARLWVRSLDSLEARSLPGTDGAGFPFWSPDNRALGFFTGGLLKTIDVSGGAVQTVCDVQASNVRGGTWNSDDVIVFGSQAGGLYRVSANGGSPTPLTTPDTALEERGHRYPSFLPDGRHFLYWTAPQNNVLLGSLDSKETTRLLTADSQATYGAPGSLLFVRRGTLMAQTFDAQRRTLTGEAVPIADQIVPDPVGGSAFTASLAGALAYRIGTIGVPTQLTWVDRNGKPLGTVGAPGSYRNLELSPDGMRVAVEVPDPRARTQDIWVVELARGVASRVTFEPTNDVYPVWSPDGSQIMFGSDRNGVFNLYRKRADGAGSETLVLKSATDMVPYSWSPDGRTIVYRTTSEVGGTNLGIFTLDAEGATATSGPGGPAGGTPRLFDPSRFNQGTSQVSPDGRWVAYVSGESGRNEIHVQSFPSPGRGKMQVSRGGSSFARWRSDGRELFYYSSDGRLVAVPVASGSTFEVGTATPLFEPHTLNGPAAAFGFRHQFDVARDGRFLLNVPVEETSAESITIVTHWAAGLKK
jgi:Tol biopolymer transport system component